MRKCSAQLFEFEDDIHKSVFRGLSTSNHLIFEYSTISKTHVREDFCIVVRDVVLEVSGLLDRKFTSQRTHRTRCSCRTRCRCSGRIGELIDITLVEINFKHTRAGFEIRTGLFKRQNDARHVEEERLHAHSITYNTIGIGLEHAMSLCTKDLITSGGRKCTVGHGIN